MNQETAPIDVMLLVQAAMAGIAERVEREADQLEEGSSLQPFRAAFNEWAAAFMYLAEREDELFSGHAAGRADTATPEDGAQAAMLAANKDEHREMDEKFQDVMEVLNVEIGRTSVIRRTRQPLVPGCTVRVIRDLNVNWTSHSQPLLRAASRRSAVSPRC